VKKQLVFLGTVWVYVVLFLPLMAWPAMARASPFLVCDPQPTATYYMVSLDNGPWVRTPAPLHYDLAGIAEGPHHIEVKAGNDAGDESAPASLDFNKQFPVNPGKISIH